MATQAERWRVAVRKAQTRQARVARLLAFAAHLQEQDKRCLYVRCIGHDDHACRFVPCRYRRAMALAAALDHDWIG